MQAVVGQPLALVLGHVGGKGLMGNEMICSVFLRADHLRYDPPAIVFTAM